MHDDLNDMSSKFDEGYSPLLRKIIRYLSEDARMSLLEISSKLGTSRRTIKVKLTNAEHDLGLRYIPEFDKSALGLTSPHLIRVKFSKKPDYKDIAKILSSSYIPQFAAVTKGTYDMIIYANAITSREYVSWDKRTQIMLSKYGVSWNPSDVANQALGFFPIRNELIDMTSLAPMDKEILKLLNTNARITFSEISKRLGMHFNTVAYNFNKLMKAGYIKRFTVSMDIPKNAVCMALFGKYTTLSPEYEEESAKSRILYKSSGMDYPLINRYPMVFILVGSADAFIMGVLDDYDTAYKYVVSSYKRLFAKQHPQFNYGKIEEILLGRLPLRSIDAQKEYNIIKWTVPPEEAPERKRK